MTDPTPTEHSLSLDKDEGGWDYGTCECGWSTPPVPGADIVADAYAEHVLAETLMDRVRTPPPPTATSIHQGPT